MTTIIAPIEPITVSVAEAVRISGLGRTYIYAAIANGEIKILKAGRRTLVKVSEVRRFIDTFPTRKVNARLPAPK